VSVTPDQLPPQQIAQIQSAVALLQSNLGVDPETTQLAITNPYAILAAQGDQIDLPADYIEAFNAGMLSLVPLDSGGRALRSGGPDSWACWWCTYGIQAACYVGLAALGLAITAITAGSPVVAMLVGIAAQTVSLTVVQLGVIAAAAGSISAANLISYIAQKACSAIPNTCTATGVAVSGPWQSSQIHSWGAPAPGQPSIVNFRGQPVLLHRSGGDNTLYCAAYNIGSGQWPGSDGKVNGSSIISKASVSGAVVSAINLCVAYRQQPTDQVAIRSTADLVAWTAEKVTGITSSIDPALAEYNDNLVCVVADASGNLQWLQLGVDGSLITQPAPIQGAASAKQVNLEWFNNKLICAYADKQTQALMLLGMDTSNNWTTLPAPQTSKPLKGGPAVFSLAGNTLYILFTQSDGSLNYSYATPQLVWAVETQIVGQIASTGPTVVGQGSSLFAVHIGKGGSNLWFDIAQV
jgi:hypothetical protein